MLGGDIHYENYSKPAVKIFIDFAKDFQPDIFGFGGDQLDLDIVSHWNKDKQRKNEGGRLNNVYNGFNREILDPIEKILPKHCRKIWVDGNHEDFIEQHLDIDPKFEGLVEPKKCLKLIERGWEILPYGLREDHKTVTWIGKHLGLTHGWFTNRYHAAKTADRTNKSIVYFHDHTFQTYIKESIIDDDAFCGGFAIGCLCNKKPSYGKGRPNRWVNGFCYGYLHTDSSFNLYPVLIIHGRTVINGKLYRG